MQKQQQHSDGAKPVGRRLELFLFLEGRQGAVANKEAFQQFVLRW